MRFTRCEELFGERFSLLQRSSVAVLGVGGVGGFALDCLYRSGIGRLLIVDYDRFDVTNQNRQIGSEAQGELKTEALLQRYPGIEIQNQKIDFAWVQSFDFTPFDVVIDAIDDIPAKIAIAKKTHPRLISSMGSAKRIDPLRIECDSIWKTGGDGLAKKMREQLRKEGFSGDYTVVFSREQPHCTGLGSFVGVTGSFGLALCAQAIRRIIENG